MLFHFPNGLTRANSPFRPAFDSPFGDFARYPGEIARGVAQKKSRRKMGGTPLSRSTSHLDVSVLVEIACELVRVPVVSVSVTGLGLLLGGLLHHECFGGQQQ